MHYIDVVVDGKHLNVELKRYKADSSRYYIDRNTDIYFSDYARTTNYNNIVVFEYYNKIVATPFWGALLEDFKQLSYDSFLDVMTVNDSSLTKYLDFATIDVNKGILYNL